MVWVVINNVRVMVWVVINNVRLVVWLIMCAFSSLGRTL